MNYRTLLVQVVELLSGGKVGNITINGTVCKYTNHTSYSIILLCHSSFISVPSIIIPPVNRPIQALSEGFNCDNIIVAYNYSSMALLLHLTGIIIGVVVSILLVLLLLIIATISVIISLRKRRQGQSM